MKQVFLLLCATLIVGASPSKKFEHTDEGINYWNDIGKEEIKKSKEIFENLNTNKAKNIIIFVGDGMSLPTLTAARIYKAQKKVNFDGSINGEESLLFFETFPHVALSKTYSVDYQTPDSSSTATAMFTGVKTNSEIVGYDYKVKKNNVENLEHIEPLKSILYHAQKAGKDTGFVTTTRITHATPACLYAHSANREWECYQAIEGLNLPPFVHDIAWQLMNQHPGNSTKVMLGGGLKAFKPKSVDPGPIDEEYSSKCYSKDQDLIQDFQDQSEGNVFVENRTDLLKVDVSKTDRLLGLFSDDHCIYDHERVDKNVEKYQDSPSLTDMTKKAIEMLAKNKDKGYFLMVEGGRIDQAHHHTLVNAALDETVAFDEAIEAAVKLTDHKDTLIIVTADHGHTMTISGYPTRGTDVRSFALSNKTVDGLPVAILSYANGHGFDNHLSVENNAIKRSDLRSMNMTDFYFNAPSSVAMKKGKETHSAADVGIFATGPFSHLFQGVHEQTYIYHVMAYSACLDNYRDESHCGGVNEASRSSIGLSMTSYFMIFFLVFN